MPSPPSHHWVVMATTQVNHCREGQEKQVWLLMPYRALVLPPEHAERGEISVFSSRVFHGCFQGGRSTVFWFRHRDMAYRHSIMTNCPGDPTHVVWEAHALGFALTENGCGSSQQVRLLRGYCYKDEDIVLLRGWRYWCEDVCLHQHHSPEWEWRVIRLGKQLKNPWWVSKSHHSCVLRIHSLKVI